MSNISSIFALFLVLAGVMLFGIWSNTQAYAQQSSAAPPPATASSPSTTISPEIKAKMCNPSNPSLKVVNTTESRICGIPKTVNPPLASSAVTPQATSALSSSPPQQTPATKPANTIAPPKQQQIANTNDNIPRSAGSGSVPIIAPLSHPTFTSPSGIAPQVKAVNQQQQHPAVSPINGTAGINSTAGQNYTFAATSPAFPSGQVLYLGYHGTAPNPTHGNSGSKQDSTHDNNSHSSTSDRSSKDKDANDVTSSVKKKTSSTKSDRTDSTNAESSSKDKNTHNTGSSSDHAADSGSSSKKWTKSDDGSSKQNADSSSATSSSHSTENGVSSIIVKSFNFKHSSNYDSSNSYSSIENDILPSVIVKSFNFR